MSTSSRSATPISKSVFQQSDARTNLPEYKRWQNAMRPEDTGHAEGTASIPDHNETNSQFEDRIRNHLSSRLSVVKNKFAQDDAPLATEMAIYQPELHRLKELLDVKIKEAKRPVIIRIGQRTGLLTILATTLFTTMLMFILWNEKEMDKGISLLLSFVGAGLLSLVAYPCGLTLRQSARNWPKWLTAFLLTTISIVLFFTAANMDATHFNTIERCTISLLIILAIFVVGACAFMMHDSDPAYEYLDKQVKELHNRIANLGIRRQENWIFHINSARRHVELARQTIAVYRQANILSRPEGSLPPAFFDTPPDLPEIRDDFLKYLNGDREGENR